MTANIIKHFTDHTYKKIKLPNKLIFNILHGAESHNFEWLNNKLVALDSAEDKCVYRVFIFGHSWKQ